MNAIDLINRFRTDVPLSPDELDWLLAWMVSGEGKQCFEGMITERWAAFDTAEEWNYEQTLQKLHQRIVAKPAAPMHRLSVRRAIRYTMELAAAAVIVLGISLLFKNTDTNERVSHPTEALAELVEIYNPKGLRTSVILPDSSKVTLNADSKITYVYGFQGSTRTVTLEGEAFFEVTKNTQKPFIVETTGAEMIVLGTSFNVRSYPTDEFVETTLVEGLLTIAAGSAKQLLKPGKQCSVNKLSKESDVHTANLQTATAWKEGKIYFHSNSFTEIITLLERTFNVNIRVNNSALLSKKFTGKFENGENLNQILQVLQLSVAFSETYDKETNTIIIT